MALKRSLSSASLPPAKRACSNVPSLATLAHRVLVRQKLTSQRSRLLLPMPESISRPGVRQRVELEEMAHIRDARGLAVVYDPAGAKTQFHGIEALYKEVKTLDLARFTSYAPETRTVTLRLATTQLPSDKFKFDLSFSLDQLEEFCGTVGAEKL